MDNSNEQLLQLSIDPTQTEPDNSNEFPHLFIDVEGYKILQTWGYPETGIVEIMKNKSGPFIQHAWKRPDGQWINNRYPLTVEALLKLVTKK